MAFSTLPEKDFVDRRELLALLSERLLAAHDRPVQSAVLSAPRGMGKTELLKQLFGHLFWKQDRIIPFFFAVHPAQLSATRFARSYLVKFLCHVFAFQKRQQTLLRSTGMSLDALSDLAADHGGWARDLVARYRRSEQDPFDALEIAVNAPFDFTMATGMPAAVLIDDAQFLQNLVIDGVTDTGVSSVFQEPFLPGRTPHLVTGNGPEIQEMAWANGLEQISLAPLGIDDAISLIRAHLGEPGSECVPPPFLLRRLGGNPLYLKCVAERVRMRGTCDEASFQDAYIGEILDGALASFWIAALKRFVPHLEMRPNALSIFHLVHSSTEHLPLQRISRHLSLTDAETASMLQALYRAGLVRGEFGIFRPVEDRVARDVLEHLYQKEILAETRGGRERAIREQLRPEQEGPLRYDLVIPMTRESELVAAQCLEQIGKNLHLHEDTIGQLQIAVIEACINAIEHCKGLDDTVAVSIVAGKDQLAVSIEHAGPEFIIRETGETSGKASPAASPRGWGIKVMKRFVDEVRFERTSRGTRTVLIKNLQAPAAAQKEDAANHG